MWYILEKHDLFFIKKIEEIVSYYKILLFLSNILGLTEFLNSRYNHYGIILISHIVSRRTS